MLERPAFLFSRFVAQFGSASALGAEGREFNSRRTDHFMPQWCNWQSRQIQNLNVGGSSPPCGTNIEFRDLIGILDCLRSSVGRAPAL